MSLAVQPTLSRTQILAEALRNAAREMGFTQEEVGEIIGKDRTAISKGTVDPTSKAGELALLLIRCYRSLFVLVGGEPKQMKHWLRTANRHTRGIPAEQMKQATGLVAVMEYLDAARGKV